MTDWLSPPEVEAILLSLKVAFWATLISLPFGIAVGFILARFEFPGKQVLNGLVHLPLILPPVVTGFILLKLFGTQGPIGSVLKELGIVIAFSWTGAALAAAIMAFPLMVRAIRLSFETIDSRLEDAARSLGGHRWHVFCVISLPLALPGIVTGAILAFAKAIGEFGATITFVSNIPGETRTLPSAVYSFMQVPGGEESAYRLVILAVLVSMTALILSEWLAKRVKTVVEGT
ncbi:MAG: molybdate ABC transporter permease subunit [Litorivicinaceae bacterium]